MVSQAHLTNLITMLHLWLELFMHTLCSCLILCLFKAKVHVYIPEDGQRWADVLTLPLLLASPRLCNKSFPRPPPRLFVWYTEASGWTWHVEAHEYGPGIQNSGLDPLLTKDTVQINKVVRLGKVHGDNVCYTIICSMTLHKSTNSIHSITTQ
jgi:hypothetical protein